MLESTMKITWLLLPLLIAAGCGAGVSPIRPSPTPVPVITSPPTNPNAVHRIEPILCPPEYVPFLPYCQFRLDE